MQAGTRAIRGSFNTATRVMRFRPTISVNWTCRKYQLFVFNGSKTYGVYPQAVMKNDKKTTGNIDILSTVNFSWLTMQPYTTSGFINSFLSTLFGSHGSQTYLQILKQMNQNPNWNVYYWIHGLDDTPHFNPYTDRLILCGPCIIDADCSGAGNRCIPFQWGKVCGAESTADDGGPEADGCFEIDEGSQIVDRPCLPRSLRCK